MDENTKTRNLILVKAGAKAEAATRTIVGAFNQLFALLAESKGRGERKAIAAKP